MFKLSSPGKRLITSLRSFSLLLVMCLSTVFSEAQSGNSLANVHVAELTDEQLQKFVVELRRRGITDEQLESAALDQGMNPVEIVRLKTRIQAARKFQSSSGISPADSRTAYSRTSDSMSLLERRPLSDYQTLFSVLKNRNFGFEVFNNPRISFEPPLNIPTPAHYQLAAGDELAIEVSGNSEASYKLKVSPEGIIRIPVAGPVSVTGLTLEQAQKLIFKKLSTSIYSSLKSGRSRVDVSLGSIRSIRVTIIGEAVLPGTYTLPSIATVFNALYACGGPGENGSFRNIELIRNNKTIAVIDVYRFLTTGNKKEDIRLLDQDIIKISVYEVRIDLRGEIKKPGVYDVAPNETLGQIFNYAGGFTENAYTSRIQVFSNTDKERQVSTIAGNEIQNLTPKKGDSYVVGKILNRFINRISLEGAIYRPGEYELKPGMTLLNLIKEADGVREDAFLSRGVIHRLKNDLSPEVVSFDIEQLLTGKQADILLQKEDRIVVYSKFDLKEGYFVRIEGEVSSPGSFLYEEGMQVQDLILMAGGLKESSLLQRIEISRRVKDSSASLSSPAKTAIIIQQDLKPDLRDSNAIASFSLLPFDEVVVRPSPNYYAQKNVVIEGEVLYKGKYTLETKEDRISDLIKRSGGLTAEAYLKGAVLVRTRHFTRAEQTNYEQGLKNLIKQNLDAGTAPASIQNQLTEIIQKRSDLVGIDLERIINDPHSTYDLLLNDGDTLRIPKQLQTVRVNGEVLYPTLVRFNDAFRFKDYVLGAGGFSERSARKKSYVMHPNGVVRGTKYFLFFKNYPTVTPGAEIYVPLKRERERLRTGEVVTIGATLISMLAILFNAIK